MAAGTDCCRGADEAGHQGRQQQLRLQHACQRGMIGGVVQQVGPQQQRRAGPATLAQQTVAQGNSAGQPGTMPAAVFVCSSGLEHIAEATAEQLLLDRAMCATAGSGQCQKARDVCVHSSGLEQPLLPGATARSCCVACPARICSVSAVRDTAFRDTACCLCVCTSTAFVV